MKLQNLTIIFIIIILPIILVLSAYVGYEVKTINKQNTYNSGIISATHDAILSFETSTKNDEYNNNAELKRSSIKDAVKVFENSLSTACNLNLYNNEEIEEYIPAIVFGLYDGFYMYAPSELTTIDSDGKIKKEYKHNLRNYVYYSEELKDDSTNTDVVIRYSLDNYVAITGTVNGVYVTRSGYLANLDDFTGTTDKNKYDGKRYKGIEINGQDAIEYYKDSYEFSYWFIKDIKLGKNYDYLKISSDNDPEDENSPFVQHKRQIMKQKIEETLNSSITAYSNKSRNNYKMPKFSEEDWEKIYTNISVISFVQGMNLGFKDYNNYCILNSTNNQEYVNPNLIYFVDDETKTYHDIRCEDIEDMNKGYKIGDFEKLTRNVKNEDGEITGTEYYYKHNETACYKCINGSLNTNISIYDYVRDSETDSNIRRAYFTALARERYNTTKLSNQFSKELRSPEEAAKSFEGDNKTYDEVVSILNYIYNKYTFNDDSKTIFVENPENTSLHAHMFIPYYKTRVEQFKGCNSFNITSEITPDGAVVLKITKNN